jgi:hypothetical protein
MKMKIIVNNKDKIKYLYETGGLKKHNISIGYLKNGGPKRLLILSLETQFTGIYRNCEFHHQGIYEGA